MPKKTRERKFSSCRDDDEFVKAAAWAWYQHGAGSSSKLISESDVPKRQKPASTTARPSRFKLEAARLANLNIISLSKNPRSVDGLEENILRCCQLLEFHENEDVGDSSLLDHYEILELTRSVEKSLSISIKKPALHSEKSWIERVISGGIVHLPKKGIVHIPKVDVPHNNHKKKDFKIKHWWTPAMCRMTDVVIPGMNEIRSPKRSPSHSGDSKLSDRSHAVRQRLRQALVVTPGKSPSHGNNHIRGSSATRNSYKRQTYDHGSS